MRIADSFRMALGGISVHKSRSALTILGVLIGIASIMAIMSIGQSAEGLIVGEIQKFGPTNIFVLPGRQPKGPTEAAGTLLNDSLKQKDLDDLAKETNVSGAKRVVPYVFGLATASFGSETYDAMVIGSTEYMKKNFDLSVTDGIFFDAHDVDQNTNVAVLGDRTKKELFGNQNAIGEKIKVKNQKLKVIGVLKPEGQGSFIDFNKTILAPYPLVQKDILGIRHFQRIIVEANSIKDIPGVIRDIKTTIRNNHNIDDPEKDDFFIQTQEDIANRIKTITGILTVLLSSVAATSLVVGGVGIMNIMLVSITERTREIGLRKALGATNKNILSQFLLEAVFLTGGGGVLGVFVGASVSFLITVGASYFTNIDFPYIFSGFGVFLGILVACGAGLFFGIFPANNASKKSPIETLRYE